MKRKTTLFGKSIFILLLLFLTCARVFGQSITDYSFTGTTGTFTPITGGSTTTWTGSTDDGISALIPIGFDFWYMGVRYTSVGTTTNGWLSLGAVPSDNIYTNNLSSSGSPRPVLAPLWDDLDIVSTANVTYKTTGTVGSRVFTIQYLNNKWNYQAAGAVCSFQVNLYETSGKIEFVYRSDATSAKSPSASIGITGSATGSGNYLSVNNAGTSVSSTSESSITTKRVTGRRHTFTPPIPTAPSNLIFTSLTTSSMTLEWADLSANETGFVIYRSTDGTNYTFASQTAAGATSSVQSGLSNNTTYYWRVYAVSAGGLSNPLSGSQATSCTGPSISQLPGTNLISYYKLEGSANDATGNNQGTFQGGTPAQAPDRFGIAGKAYTLNGASNYISTSNSYVNPSPLSVSSWFKTTTTAGGVLVGFSSLPTGSGGNRDRFIYMTGSGALYFAVAPGAVKKYISTNNAYNDGNWHLVTGTIGSGGMKLYVDGELVASDQTVTSCETTTGYWRVGHSDVSTWPNAPASYYFQGTLDDVVVYHRELSPSEIGTLYTTPDGAGSNSPVCAGASLNLTATSVAGGSYLWSGPNGFTSTQQNPSLTYSAAYTGTYSVQVTAPGCLVATTAYANVISTPGEGQWTGNVSTDWSNASNWCNGVLPTSLTDVVITSSAIRMPSVSTGVSCKSLTVNSGASFTLTTSGILNIAGLLANSGTISNSGTVNFNGTTGQQTFSGISTFYNLTISNNNGLLLPSAIVISNDLTISSGTLNAGGYGISIAGNWINNASAGALQSLGTVTFTSTSVKTIGGSFPTTFNNLVIAASGSTLSLATNISITGNLSVNAGVFDLLGFTANRISAGGILTVANNSTLKIGGTNTYPSNYATNTLVTASTVEYSGTNQTVANQVYGNLRLTSATGAAIKTFPSAVLTVVGNLTSAIGSGTSVTFTAGSAITVNGNVSIGASTTFNGSSYTHTIGGNWNNSGTFNGNTGTLTFTGSGSSVGGAGIQNFNNLTVAASLINFSAEGISLTGNLATTGPGSFTQASGGTITMTGTGTTISGQDISPDNLTVSGSVSTSASLAVTGHLSVSGSFTANAGTITMSGTAKSISGSGTKTFNVLSATGTITTNTNFSVTSGLLVYGSFTASAGTATFTGTSSISGTANLFNTNINGTSLQLSANSVLGVAGALTVTAGTLNVSSTPNTVNYNGSGAQTITALTYNNLTTSNSGSKTAAGAIVVNNNITIGTGTTLIAGAFTHSVYNNWYNNGGFTAGTGTIQILGTQNSVISGATTFNVLTVNNTNAAVELALLNNVSAATVNMVSGTMLTGSNTLTITSARTGNGIILGKITRNHAFESLTAYAFEGPNNLITFTNATGIGNVIVEVTATAPGDFPFNGSISRTYTVTVPSGTYDSAVMRLHYEDSELNGNTESSIGLWRYNGSSWISIGKTSNNSSSNYIEQTLLPNITNRWTMSDNSNVVRWNGSVSTDWNTAANWTVEQGSASAPPGPTDIVNLGVITFNNQPTISNAVTVKNINFGSAKAVTLSMAAGGSLVSSDMKGNWGANASHTINANAQTITVNGDFALSDGTAGHTININIGSGTINILGSLTEKGNANITFSGLGNLNIGGNFNYENGIFTPGSGTVTYNGNLNQNVASVNYNNLTINKSAANAIANSSLAIAGNFTITSGAFDSNGTTAITGNVTIASGTTFQNNGTVTVGGNWNNSGSFTSTNSDTTIIFNGTGPQNIAATTFNNLEFNKPIGAVATLTGDVTIKGNLKGTSGTLDIKSFFFNRDVQGGSAILDDAGTLIIAANNAPNKFANYVMGAGSTVIFNGTATQHLLLPGVSYGNIIFRNSGTKILYTSIVVKNDLTIEPTAIFDAGANAISLSGNWVNNGTFVPSTSTVLFKGSSKNITGDTTFNKITVTGSYTIINNTTYNGVLEITGSGALNGGTGIHTTLNSDLINSGTLYTLGTTTFTGNVQQTLSLINAVTTVAITVNFNGSVSPVLNSTSVPQFGYLNINNTGGVHPSVGWTVAYALTIGNGATFNGGSSTHNLLGTLTNNGTVTSSGTVNFIPSSAVLLNMGTNFSSTGTIVFGGTGAITLSGNPGSLHDVVISNTNPAGINAVSNLAIGNNFTINSGSLFSAGSYSYLLGGNLISNGTLSCGTSIFTLNGSGLQTIYTVSPLYKLTVNNSNGVSLSSDLTVNNVLTFTAGKIQTGDYVLIQPLAGTVSGAGQNTGWVNGRFRKNIGTGAVTKAFEIGNSLSYLPVSVAFANVGTSGDLTVSTTDGDQQSVGNSMINPDKTVNRYWTFDHDGIQFTTAAITFNYAAADIDAGASTTAFVVGGYRDGSWTYPMVGALNATSLTATGINSLGDFQIGEMAIFIKTWDGGAGTSNWGDAANWNTNGVPGVNDNVELTGPYTININVPATTKNLLISNSGLVLSTVADNTLSVSGDLTLASGTLNLAGAFPTATGTMDFSGGTVGFTGTGAQTIPAYSYYNLSSSSTGPRILSSDGVIAIANSFVPGTNAYTVTGSTVTYNGAGPQTVAATAYNNLLLQGGSLKTFAAGTTQVAGSLVMDPGTGTDAVSNASAIRYNGAGNQTVTDIVYYDLTAANVSGIVTLEEVTVKNNFNILSGTVNIGNSAVERKIDIDKNLIISNGATLTIASTSDALHSINMGGDIINNGVLDFIADANSIATVNFIKDGNQVISGSGTSEFYTITLNQGTSNLNVLEVNAQGFSAPSGFLTLQNGTFKVDNPNLSLTPFNSDITTGRYLIPATAGLWVNSGTIHSVPMNWTVAGLVQVAGGTLNMGAGINNTVIPKEDAMFLIAGGTLNLASAIGNPGAAWSFDMSGGTMNVNMSGSTASNIAPFMMDTTDGIFNVTDGTIVIQHSGGSTGQNFGYHNISEGGSGFTGGTLQMGSGATTGIQIMSIESTMPVYDLALNSANVTVMLFNSDLTVANDVNVVAGTLDINDRTLKIGGDIATTGDFIVNEGTVEMNGSALQTISASAFTGNQIRNLTVTNNAGVDLTGTLKLTEILRVNTGALNADGHLRLVSTADKTALIDGSGSGEVTGNVTMERYLAAGFGYKYFSSPFQDATVNSFASTVDLNASFPNFYKYIENKESSGFTAYIDPTGLLHPLQGYAADFGSSTAQKTVVMAGTVNNGPLATPLYNHNQPYTRGFNLVGNPYPSPIDWDAATGWNRTNIDDAVYFYDSGTASQYTGAYSTYINGVSSDGIAGPIIASMQGFFVHVSDGTYPVAATFGINNAARVNDLSPVFHKSTMREIPRVLIRLSANYADNSKSADPLVVYAQDEATAGFDKSFDAIKLMNIDEQVPNLYSLGEDASQLAINGLTAIDAGTVIPLEIKTEKDGEIKFSLRDLENWPTGLNLYLTDAVTGIDHDLRQESIYAVYLSKGSSEGRFSLRCTAANANIKENDIFYAYESGDAMFIRIKLANEEAGTIIIHNLLGQLVSRTSVQSNGDYQLGQLTPDTVYIVTFDSPHQKHSIKIIAGDR